MTIDEIHRVYDDAYKQYQREPVNGWSAEKAERFALCSVVRALRDEYTSSGYRMMTSHHFDEILDSDAGEKVAGGSTREDEQSCNSSDGSSPATDAAPAVCEWRGSKDGQLAYMGCTKRLEWTYDRRKCPSCGKSITFTEAK